MTDDTSQEFLDELLAQEKRLVFPRFDNDTAISLGLLLVDMARQRSLPVTIDITRAGHQLFHVALPGTSSDNDEWVKRKVATVMRFAPFIFLYGPLNGREGRRFLHALSARSDALRAARRVVPDHRRGHGRRRHCHHLGPASGRGSCFRG